jgi:hypothetical protein
MGESSFIFTLLALIYAVVMFMLPFFVLRIRSEVIAMNKRLERIEELLAKATGLQADASPSILKSDDRGRLVKVCRKCGRKNRAEEMNCIGCGEVLQ